jgi:hypothetical protein
MATFIFSDSWDVQTITSHIEMTRRDIDAYNSHLVRLETLLAKKKEEQKAKRERLQQG